MKAARRGPPRREGGAACGGGNARAARMSDGAANCARRSSEASLRTSPSRTRSTPSRNSRPPTPPNGAHHRGTRSGRRRSPTTAASIGRPEGRILHEISSCKRPNCGPSFDDQSRFRETPDQIIIASRGIFQPDLTRALETLTTRNLMQKKGTFVDRACGRRRPATGQPAGRPVAPLASGRPSLLEGKHPPQQRHALTSYPISYGDPRLAASRSQIVHRIRAYQRPEDPNDADKRGFRYISGQLGSKQGG